MNKHILFVIDHLANPDKYTQEELLANYAPTRDAYYAAAYWAAYYAATYRASEATYWVNEYFKITGEDKQTYIDALGE
jgi:hypothetical protein